MAIIIMEAVSGNGCIFCLLVSSVLLVFLVGIVNMGSGIYVCVDSEEFNWFDGGFIVIGLVLVLVSILAFYSKKSFGRVTLLLLFMVVCFLSQIGLTLGVFFYSDYDKQIDEDHANIIRYIYCGMCAVLLVSTLLSYCYRRSLMLAEFKRDNDVGTKFIDISKKKKEVKQDTQVRESLF